jgi:hypothetical protein
MSWPGHDDAPHFQIFGGEHPHVKGSIDALSTFAGRNRRAVMVFLSAAVIAGTVALGPRIKDSIIRTLERIGQSAELQGRAFTDITQSPTVSAADGPDLPDLQ